MERNELHGALEQLGELVPPGSEIVLAGGTALIFAGYIERGTGDRVREESARPDCADSAGQGVEDLTRPGGDPPSRVKGWPYERRIAYWQEWRSLDDSTDQELTTLERTDSDLNMPFLGAVPQHFMEQNLIKGTAYRI